MNITAQTVHKPHIAKNEKQFVRVGVGVIIQNKEGNVLIGKRKGSHAQYYSIPGGNMEIGESFEQTATREIQEETNLIIENPQVIAVTNNIETYKKENIHYCYCRFCLYEGKTLHNVKICLHSSFRRT